MDSTGLNANVECLGNDAKDVHLVGFQISQ